MWINLTCICPDPLLTREVLFVLGRFLSMSPLTPTVLPPKRRLTESRGNYPFKHITHLPPERCRISLWIHSHGAQRCFLGTPPVENDYDIDCYDLRDIVRFGEVLPCKLFDPRRDPTWVKNSKRDQAWMAEFCTFNNCPWLALLLPTEIRLDRLRGRQGAGWSPCRPIILRTTNEFFFPYLFWILDDISWRNWHTNFVWDINLVEFTLCVCSSNGEI